MRKMLSVKGMDLKKFRGILGGTCPQPVEPQGEFISPHTGIVFILSPGVQFAVDQLPVVAIVFFIVPHGDPSSPVVHLDGMVPVDGDSDGRTISFSRLVHRVGQYFKKGVLTALQSVRTENNRRTQPHSVRAFQLFDRLVVVLCRFLFFRHVFLTLPLDRQTYQSNFDTLSPSMDTKRYPHSAYRSSSGKYQETRIL